VLQQAQEWGWLSMEQRIECLAAKACPLLALPCAGLGTVRVPTLPAATHGILPPRT